MLHRNDITNIEMNSPEWKQFRAGKFTSSLIHNVMGESLSTKGAISYIYHKVGEHLTGINNDKEFEFDEDIEWGKLYESEAINAFGLRMGIQFLVTQKLIHKPSSMYSTTPDCLWVHGQCKIDDNEYNVSTGEAKCPRTYKNFMEFSLCETPRDVFKINKKIFWQTIDQMHQCGAAIGYLFAYHPLFPEGLNLKIIEFKKMQLWDEFKLLTDRKKQLLVEFERVKTQFLYRINKLTPTLATYPV